MPPPAPVIFPEKTVTDQVSGHPCKQEHHSTVDRALHKRLQQFYGLWDGEEDTEGPRGFSLSSPKEAWEGVPEEDLGPRLQTEL